MLKPFEDDLINLVRNIEFEKVDSPFLKKLNDDANFIKESSNIFVSADKTTNIYQVSTENYIKVLKENVTKNYKKTDVRVSNQINNEAADIANKMKLSDKRNVMRKKNAFITFNTTKNFFNRPKCRLINPAKSEVGRISKIILEDLNKSIRSETNLLQLRNTSEVIRWFESKKHARN